MRSLYFGDNLDILREHVRDESVDLVYLDPPFNSKRDYNLLFKTPKGHSSDAQIVAFEDSWHWGEQAEREFKDLLQQPNTDVAEMIQAFRRFLGENEMMAYLTMIANRLLDLRRVMKPTGSLYLHCDPTASHYLKILMDSVFMARNFRNEIIWCYRGGGVPKKDFANRHDVILRYSKTNSYYFNVDAVRIPYSKESQDRLKYKAKSFRGDKIYDAYEQNALGKHPEDWWEMQPIMPSSKERLGYPTQKPLTLLERIISASSNPGDIVLDPFCGCGTAVHAAEKLGRSWIGIDITHLAISLIEKRLRSAFPQIVFDVHGTPKDAEGAQNLSSRDKYQFQWWACSLVNAQPYRGKKKGADGGTDGLIFFQDDASGAKKIIVSVKGGGNVTRTMISDLKNTVEREKATIGLFVTLAPPTQPMITEAASAGFYESPLHGSFPKIQILTIEGLLDGREQPRYPDMARGAHTFRQAKREEEGTEQPKLLGE